MSDIVKPPAAAPAVSDRTDGPPNPLRGLPKEWRPVVSFFWMANEGLLKTPLELVTRLRFWMDPKQSLGLTLDELKPILTALLQPGAMAGFEFGTQLLAELSRRVALVPMERRKRAAKAAPATAPPTPEEREKIRKLTALHLRTQSLFATPE